MLLPALTQCMSCCLNLFLAHLPPFSKRRWCWKTDHCRIILSIMCEWKKLNWHMSDKYASYDKSLSPSSAASPLPPRHEGIGLQQLEGRLQWCRGKTGWKISSDFQTSVSLGPAHLGKVLVPGGHYVAEGILAIVSCQFPGALAQELRPSGLSGVQCIEAKVC